VFPTEPDLAGRYRSREVVKLSYDNNIRQIAAYCEE